MNASPNPGRRSSFLMKTILLEARGVRLIRELDHDVRLPGTVLRRMRAVSLVVPRQPLLHVARHPDVIRRRTLSRLQHVNESLRRHPNARRQVHCQPKTRRISSLLLGGAQDARFLRRSGAEWIAEFCSLGLACRANLARKGTDWRSPPALLCGYGATAFAWLAEPKLTRRRQIA
jgi:hypothetical protein